MAHPGPSEPDDPDQGGDDVCWLDRVCPACGALEDGPPPEVCTRCGAVRPPATGPPPPG